MATSTGVTTPNNSSLQSDPKNDEKPKVLLFESHPHLETALSPKYDILRAHKSSLPLPAFLSAHGHHIQALVTMSPTTQTIDSAVLDQLPSLRLISTFSVGVDHIDLDTCRKRGIAVTNAGENYSSDAADFGIGLLIDVLRKVTIADRYVRNGLWIVKGDYPLGTKVSGKRIGIVGLGSIGAHVAKRLAAFGCPISYYSRAPKPKYPSYKYYPSVLDLAGESDVLVLACALTAETQNIINRDVMEELGKAGLIINIGRGGLIDEPELVRCLKEGVIAGAGLDVFVNEPEVPKEILNMENVVLSNHRAITTPESFHSVLQLVIANLEAFFTGNPLLSPVSR